MLWSHTSSWCLSFKWVIYRDAFSFSQLVFFFFFNLYHKQIASIMERKPDWIWIFFFLMLLPVSCSYIQMDVILSDDYLALIYNYYIIGDYVAIYTQPGCTPGLYRCMSTRKYKWIYMPGFTLPSLKERAKNPQIGLVLSGCVSVVSLHSMPSP